MKTLYLTNGCTNIAVDKDTDEVTRVDAEGRYGIRDIYYITEPMHVVYGYQDKHDEIDVNPGDILIQFYDESSNKHILAVANSELWTENILYRQELMKKEREQKELAQTPCGGECCDTACPC